MKYLSLLTGILLSVISCSFFSCDNQEEDQMILDHSYAGVLSVQYSKDFPDFDATAQLSVEITKEGVLTFSGGGDSDEFEAEDVMYNDGKPFTKVRITGTLVFNGAQGRVMLSGNEAYAMVRVNSDLNVQMIVWAWDEDLGWVQILDQMQNQQDKYSDGEFQYKFIDASSPSGQDIKRTLPDLQGTFTYGYNLTLIPGID